MYNVTSKIFACLTIGDNMKTLKELLQNEYFKITLSRPEKGYTYKKVCIKRLKNAGYLYQAEKYTETQVLHENFNDPIPFVLEYAKNFKDINLMGEVSYSAKLSNGEVVACFNAGKGNQVSVSHNREKDYPLPEGEEIPAFVKIGIFTKDYKIVSSKQDKFRQINRFIQMLSDVIKEYKEGDEIYVVDYCSGKSYLSFAVYHYLVNTLKLKVKMTCIDLKEDVINKCREFAIECGYEGMEFIYGDIRDFTPERQIDLVISLHACDIATDYVLSAAVNNNAKKILSVPCCQHELNKGMSDDYAPLLTRYGILKERLAAMITDSVRCTLLELNDYKVELLEFVDITHSPKNLLIRASRCKHSNAYKRLKREELDKLLQEVGCELTAVKLLYPES